VPTISAPTCDEVRLVFPVNVIIPLGTYRIDMFRDGEFLRRGGWDTWVDRTVLPQKTYQYTASYVTYDGHESPPITIPTVTTPACDAQPVYQTAPQLEDPSILTLSGSTGIPDFIKTVWDGARSVVFALVSDSSGARHLRASVAGQASVQADYEVSTIETTLQIVDVISTPTGFLLAAIDSGQTATQIAILRVDSYFRLLGRSTISAPYVARPVLAGGNGHYAVYFEEVPNHQSIYFTPLHEDGTVAGSTTDISSTSINHRINGQMAWDGTQFGVAYENDFASISASGGNGEVYLLRLSPTGTILSDTPVSDAMEMGMLYYMRPAIVGAPGGGFYVAWPSSVGALDDLVAARFDPTGRKIGSTIHLTNDGATTLESKPTITTSAAGVFIGYQFQPARGVGAGARLVHTDFSLQTIAGRDLVPSGCRGGGYPDEGGAPFCLGGFGIFPGGLFVTASGTTTLASWWVDSEIGAALSRVGFAQSMAW
jgi:hypothetical protein